MEARLKANTAATVVFPLLTTAGGGAYQSSATIEAGDIKICKWVSTGGGQWNVSNIGSLPTEIGTTGLYAFVLTADELNPADATKPIIIKCKDASGAQWDETSFIIRVDSVQSDVAKVGGDAQSMTDLKDMIDTAYDPAGHNLNTDIKKVNADAAAAAALQDLANGGGWRN